MTDDKLAVAIDYESTYSTREKFSLTSMPTWKYCADARFDAYLVAICGWGILDDGLFVPDGELEGWEPGKTVTRWTHGGRAFVRKLPDGRQLYVGRPEKFQYWGNLRGRPIVCHNASFDEVVTLELVKRGLLPAFLRDNKYCCTADLAAFLLVPRNLKGAMKELYGKEISKEVRAGMDGRHDYELSEKEYHDLVEYGGSDSVECHDIWKDFADRWPYMERRISELNRESTIRGVLLDLDYVKAAAKELKRYLAELTADIPWYPEKPVGSLPALRAAVVAMGIEPPKSFKKDDPGFLDWQKDHDEIPFIRARQKAVSVTMNLARIESMLENVDSAGRSHPAFMYAGAHTLRFTGRAESGGNVNLLNLPRKPVMSGDEHVFEGKGVDIRGMYIPDPGCKFAVYDYAQVESRFALWLVDDTHMMSAMEKEGNLYTANAVMMGWCKSGDKIKKTNPDLYRLAKCCLHGDTPVLVRSEKKDGGLTKPYYKRIIRVTPTDRVWDGHEWVRHLGVEKMKEVKSEELVEIGGIGLTRDHRVYIGETESRRADEILGDEQAAAMAWGDTHNPVRGWAHVRILAAYLARACARALGLYAREALHILARALHLHGVRRGDVALVGQRPEGADDEVREVRAQGVQEEGRGEHVGEGAR